jgi:hypothetical protein
MLLMCADQTDRRSIAFYSLKNLFNSSFIPAYQTTIRTSINDGIAAAERYIRRRVAADEAAPAAMRSKDTNPMLNEE